MGVDEDRRSTARERRRLVLEAFGRHLSVRPGTQNAVSRFRGRLQDEYARVVVGNLDIDGLVSASMLAGYSSWRVGVVIDRSRRLLVHPDLDWADLQEHAEEQLFGVDVYSPLYPTVSNHPLLFGDKARRPTKLRVRYQEFDVETTSRVEQLGSVSPSTWVGIGASLGSEHAQGLPYKYPLGTAQILLAVLELAGAEPRIFDRQYLPWIIANADGGATSIRTYAWNAELWWSAMAAAAGPASNSEAIYRLVTQQRPSEFLEADRRLRWDEPERSKALKSSWNLKSASHEHVTDAVGLITSWSGWPDPFLGGVASLKHWVETTPTRNVLALSGISARPENVLDKHLAAAMQAVHVNFSVFKERGIGLGWMLGRTDPMFDLGADVPEEEAEVDESIPDLDG